MGLGILRGKLPAGRASWHGGSRCGTTEDVARVVPAAAAASRVMLEVVRAAPGGVPTQGSVLVPAVAHRRDALEELPAIPAAPGVRCEAEVAERPAELMFPC